MVCVVVAVVVAVVTTVTVTAVVTVAVTTTAVATILARSLPWQAHRVQKWQGRAKKRVVVVVVGSFLSPC